MGKNIEKGEKKGDKTSEIVEKGKKNFGKGGKREKHLNWWKKGEKIGNDGKLEKHLKWWETGKNICNGGKRKKNCPNLIDLLSQKNWKQGIFILKENSKDYNVLEG